MDVVVHALKIAKENNVTTILNPAPAAKLDPSVFPLIDYFTPNESEASFYVSGDIANKDDAENFKVFLDVISAFSLVLGFLPSLSFFFKTLKVPNDVILILSFLITSEIILSRKVSIKPDEKFLEKPNFL